MTFLLLHNALYAIGWNAESYDIPTIIRRLLRTIAFADVEPLLVPLWFLQSLFKGLLITYAVLLLPRKWQQWIVVAILYVASLIFYEHGIHLFYSINREIGIVSAIYLGHEMRCWSHAVTWWQWLLAVAALAVAAYYWDVGVVGDNLGPFMVFPAATFLGVVFVRGIVRLFELHSRPLMTAATWMGRHSIHILILHLAGFHILSSVIVVMGLAEADGLSEIAVLPECRHSAWWVAYTAAALLTAAAYLRITRFIGKLFGHTDERPCPSLPMQHKS